MEAVIKDRIAGFTDPARRVGATHVPGKGTHLRVWAPKFEQVGVVWIGGAPAMLEKQDRGYFSGFFPEAKPGDKYRLDFGGKILPDPASRFQPEDSAGPSEVVTQEFGWTDDVWRGVPFQEWVIYEIHPGAYSEQHGFQGIIDDLPRLAVLGVTTVEIMPVSQFSGARNWGYDGVFPHAVQDSYGGPQGLKALVDACHARGLAIILDVVFNHLGPEGNVPFQVGNYTNDAYKTPWGGALNYDGDGSDDVRQYFLQAAWQWLTEYHFDGLRLDAIQMIMDRSPTPFMEELGRIKLEAEKVVGRPLVLIAETDMNDPRILAAPDAFGFGLDGQWADDLHHVLHVTLTGETSGYYASYTGGVAQLAYIYRHSVAYDGLFSPFHNKRHGRSYTGIVQNRLVVETQNHDQIGNRLLGDRLAATLDFEKLKLAAAAVHLSPFTPFVFMGEEFAAKEPFQYFISHHDPALLEAVRKGRTEEWKSFGWTQEAPDPGAEETFEACVLKDKSFAAGSEQAVMQDYYKALIALSKDIRRHDVEVRHIEGLDVIELRYTRPDSELAVLLCFAGQETIYEIGEGPWEPVLRSADFVAGDKPIEAAQGDKLILRAWSATVMRKLV